MRTVFQAGPRGGVVKSDCQVSYTPGKKPLEVDIDSKVAVLFGASIRDTVRETAARLQVTTGHIAVKDFGALPWVLSAQVETALKRAHPEIQAEARPPFKAYARYSSSRDRFRRSRLYLPGNQPKLFLNAGIHHPDGIILDLEDSVPPAEKDAARIMVRNALRSLDFFGAERMVRINQGEMGLQDLDAVIPHNVHLILVPKVEYADQIVEIDRHIQGIREEEKIDHPVYLMPILESGRGILKALEIAEASPNNVALAIGLEDYTADIGAQRTREGRESFFARSMLVNAARATGLQPIDTVYSDVNDMEGLRASVEEAKALGFDGKGCIHPRQIAIIHDAFAPGEGEIEKAKAIVLAAIRAEEKGLGVVSLGSKMIDPPVVKRAQRTIHLAIESGILTSDWKNQEE